MAQGKVSGKTHTQQQLNDWANQHNPNNKAYRANLSNHSNQLNPNNPTGKSHQVKHNQDRRAQKTARMNDFVDFVPDYPIDSEDW